ncbi:hypothetical protein GE09DRAFT_1111339 [Coniochaeta sp. 2T2.1]|nr:hypothetical protein GE09DRAFT_1111339 [Coniochaeta sp. 2T2.1]
MPSDEYSSFGKGALKLKGAGGGSKVKRHKKKKDKGAPSDLEKNLSTGGGEAGEEKQIVAKRKRSKSPGAAAEEEAGHESDEGPVRQKTEAERRFEEAKKRKLLEMSKSAAGRPELLKTHKERVEELNTYLSKLSEHHDMPKIGPG